MSLDKITQARQILLGILSEKTAPFGFGEEEGTEGFPRWSVYVDGAGQFHQEGFDEARSLSDLPLSTLASLAENALSGEALWLQIAAHNGSLRYAMLGQALVDAQVWMSEREHLLHPEPHLGRTHRM